MQPLAPGHVDRHRPGRYRICGAHVGDDPNPLGVTARKHRLQALSEERVVTGLGIPTSGLVGQRNRSLGQTLEDEVVQAALLHQLDRWLYAVTRESGAASDPD
jgi:hypothetical protein